MEAQHYGRVYLLHFEPAYKHARHYLGMADLHTLNERITEHQRGRAARLTQVAGEAGCAITVARVWRTFNRHTAHVLERRLKAHHLTKLCPLCNPRAEQWGKPSDKEANYENR